MRTGAAGRSVHHSRVDGNLMAVVERENSSLPLYLPIVHQPSGDSIRQPFDCELILSLSGYCELTAYCYCCHFSIVSHDKLSACCSCATEEVFSEHRSWFHPPCRREDTSMYVHTRACSSTATFFSHPRTLIDCGSVFPAAADLRFPQLFMSHLLGQVLCQMCVKQDLICPPVHLLIVSSSACRSHHWCPRSSPRLARGLQLGSLSSPR